MSKKLNTLLALAFYFGVRTEPPKSEAPIITDDIIFKEKKVVMDNSIELRLKKANDKYNKQQMKFRKRFSK